MPLTFPYNADGGDALAKLITVSKGTLLHRFTNWDAAVTISGVTWKPAANTQVKTQVFRTNGDAAMCSVSVSASADDLIKQTDAADGKYRGGQCIIEECDPDHPELGKKTLLDGLIGPIYEVRVDEATLLNISVRGSLSAMRGLVGKKYAANCDYDLGDDHCRVPIRPAEQTRNKVYVTKLNASTVDGNGTGFATRVRTASDGGLPTEFENVYYECTTAGTTDTVPPSPPYDPTPGNTTTDGTAVFTCRDAFTRSFEIASVDANGFQFTTTTVNDPRAVDGWFSEGYAIITDGLTPGLLIPITNWVNSTKVVTSADNLTLRIQAGDVGEIIAGCDKRRATCFSKFDNILNFGGWGTFAPGRSIADV